MSGTRGTDGVRPLLVLFLALGIAMTGCGDSGDSDATGASANSGSPEEERVADVMREVRDLYNKSDGEGFCARLTAAGREEVVSIRRDANAKAKDCAGIVTEFSKRVVSEGSPQRPIDVRRASVDGNKARLVITGGLAGVRRVVPYRFKKVNGDWKLDDPISGSTRVIRTDLSIPLNP